MPDGNILGVADTGSFSQTLTGITLQPNTTYTLSVYIGHRLDGYVTTYTVALQAGSTTLNSVSGSTSTITAGQFAQVTVSYTAGATPPSGNISIVLTAGGQMINFDKVTLTTSGGVYYYIEDLLGTSRVMTTSNGTLCYDADFDPFGGEHTYTDTCPQNYKFEGKERDTETGNDDFGARYYTSRFGRWLSADWSSVPVPVPYANLTNPQTLNLYAMVADDPESFADLDGHDELPAPHFPGGIVGDPSGLGGCGPHPVMCQDQQPKQNAQEAQGTTPDNVIKEIPCVGPAVNWLVDGDKIAQAARDVREAETVQGKIGEGTALVLLIGINVVPGAGKAGKAAAKAEEVVVYEIVEHGKTIYVGITKDLLRRQAEHGAKLIPILESLTRDQARAVEQALINHFGLGPKDGKLLNRINSISPTKNPEAFKQAVAWGKSQLEKVGYHF